MDNIATINKVIEYIEEHLTKKLDLDSITAAVHYSKFHLHRLFTNTVGLTIHDYLQRRQLTEAAKLLTFSKKSIVDIALLSGYDSQQAFSAAFKSLYKKSPGEFREAEIFYPLQLKFEFTGGTIMSLDTITKDSIRFAGSKDIPRWIELVRHVIDGFPYLIEEEHIQALKESIEKKQALIMTDGEIAIGAMIFSYTTGSIGFLGVHPLYRKRGIATAFFDKLLSELLADKHEISITTYREGDKADTGHREIVKKLGFADAELLTEFGYPTQKFILSKGKGNDG